MPRDFMKNSSRTFPTRHRTDSIRAFSMMPFWRQSPMVFKISLPGKLLRVFSERSSKLGFLETWESRHMITPSQAPCTFLQATAWITSFLWKMLHGSRDIYAYTPCSKSDKGTVCWFFKLTTRPAQAQRTKNLDDSGFPFTFNQELLSNVGYKIMHNLIKYLS